MEMWGDRPMVIWKRMFFALLLMPPLTAVVSLTFNGILFTFGPWANTWELETWVALQLVAWIIAIVFRKRWFVSDPSASASAPDIRWRRVGAVFAVTFIGTGILAQMIRAAIVMYGPSAITWFDYVWASLLLISLAVGVVFRRRWFYAPASDGP